MSLADALKAAGFKPEASNEGEWLPYNGTYRCVFRTLRAEYDEKNKVFKSTPLHDWTSHCADAIGTGAMGYEEKYFDAKPSRLQQLQQQQPHDPYSA